MSVLFRYHRMRSSLIEPCEGHADKPKGGFAAKWDFLYKWPITYFTAMYEQFTDEGRQVMLFSHMEARRLNHEYVGTEHILLGLAAQNSGVAAEVLKELALDPQRIRHEILKIVQDGPEPSKPRGSFPLTPRSNKVIQFAIEEAWKGDLVGAGHLLLGLLRETEGVAYQVLLNLGVSPQTAREKLLLALARSREIIDCLPGSSPDMREADATVQQASEYLDRVANASPVRFTKQVADVIRLANQVATRLKQEYVSPEHMLWGLLKQTSRVLVVIANMGRDTRKICQDLEIFLGGEAQGAPVAVECIKSPSPQTKSVLQLAIAEARGLKHSRAGPEHVLLGLLRAQGTPAETLLDFFGITLKRTRTEVRKLYAYSRIQAPSRPAAAEDLSHLPEDLRAAAANLAAAIDRLTREKEDAVAAQDFERAAALRDEAEKARSRRAALVRQN